MPFILENILRFTKSKYSIHFGKVFFDLSYLLAPLAKKAVLNAQSFRKRWRDTPTGKSPRRLTANEMAYFPEALRAERPAASPRRFSSALRERSGTLHGLCDVILLLPRA